MAVQFESLSSLSIAALGGVGLLTTGINLMRGSLYDINETKQERLLKRQPNKRTFRKRRFISILVIAQKNQSGLTACLSSIGQNAYRKYEIIVIDNGNADATLKKNVTMWRKSHRQVHLKLTVLKKPVGHEELLRRGSKKAKGEIIVVLDADQLIEDNLLHELNLQFALNDCNGIEFSQRVAPAPSLLNLLQRFEFIVAQKWHKGRSWTHKESGSVLKRPAAYQLDALQAVLDGKTKKLSMHFGASLAAYSLASSSYTGLVSRHLQDRSDSWQLARDLTAVAVSYLLYLAVYLKTPVWYGTVWVSISLLLMLIISTSTYVSRNHRLRLVLLTPLAALLFYVLSAIESITFIIGSALKIAAWPFKQVLRLT